MLATMTAARLAGRITPKLARPAVARLWFTPWRVPVGNGAQRRRSSWLAATRPLTVATGHGELSGFVAGGGPVVLLVHGWGAEAASLGAFIAPLVERGYQVVGVDLPAHGASPGRRTDGFVLAETLEQVAEQVGPVDAIVAHSLGAFVTTFALSKGLSVRAAVLLAPMVRLQHAVDRFGELFRLPPKAKVALRGEIERRFGPEVLHDLAADRMAPDLDVPVLIVHDRDDPQIDLGDSVRLAEQWRGARLITTSGLRHERVLHDESVVEEVGSFLGADHSTLISLPEG